MPTAPTVTRDPALEAHVFWFEHRREILIGIGVIVLALIGYAGFWFYTERQDAAAAAALAQAGGTSLAEIVGRDAAALTREPWPP